MDSLPRGIPFPPRFTSRWQAGASLAHIGGPNVVTALRSSLGSDLAGDPVVRVEAVKVLGRVRDAGERPTLEQIVGDSQEDERVREAVRTALGILKS